MVFINKKIFLFFISFFVITLCNSQELEPRAVSNLPVGSNFLVALYAYSHGEILLDPGLQIENLNANLHSTAFAYLRSINFFGMSSKVDVVLPLVYADWEGDLNESSEGVRTNGFGDLRLRFSFNFLGSPALKPSEFSNYKPNNTSGVSFQVILPTGKYDSSELVNLGANRWAFKTQYGFAKDLKKWVFEGYASIWLFTKNSNYLNGKELVQNPLYTFKIHAIRKLPKKMWVSANLGYAIGGRVYVNGESKDSKISSARLGLFYALPLNKRNTLKFGYISGIRFEKGSDFDAFSVAYQYGWNKSLKKIRNQDNK